jgi:hypothetical protein
MVFLRLEMRGEFNDFFYYSEQKYYFNTTKIGEVRMTIKLMYTTLFGSF